MRKFGFLIALGALMLAAIISIDGLQAQQKGGGAGGFGGGFGGFTAPGSAHLTLLNRKDVKTELDCSDEQLEKLPAEVLVAISKVLNEKQFKRFKQIELQQRGNRAFKDETIQTALNINDEQKKNINSILEDLTKELAEARKGKGGGLFGKGGAANNDKITKIDAEFKDKILVVLTKTQRKAWRTMIGEDFKFAAPTGGGFGGFGNKGKDAKKDPNKDE